MAKWHVYETNQDGMGLNYGYFFTKTPREAYNKFAKRMGYASMEIYDYWMAKNPHSSYGAGLSKLRIENAGVQYRFPFTESTARVVGQ